MEMIKDRWNNSICEKNFQFLNLVAIRAGSIPKSFDFDFIIGTIFDFDFGRFWQIFKERFFHDFDSEKLSQNHRFFDFDKYQPSKKLCFLLFKPKNWVELGRFQNYSIPIFNDFGKYSKIDFFTISILKNWAKIVDSSISIKIDPALLSITSLQTKLNLQSIVMSSLPIFLIFLAQHYMTLRYYKMNSVWRPSLPYTY